MAAEWIPLGCPIPCCAEPVEMCPPLCSACVTIPCALCVEILSIRIETDDPACAPSTFIETPPAPWIVTTATHGTDFFYTSSVTNNHTTGGSTNGFSTTMTCDPPPPARSGEILNWHLFMYWNSGQLGCNVNVYLTDEILNIGCDLGELLGEHTVVNTEMNGGITTVATVVYRVTAGRACGIRVPCCDKRVSRILQGGLNAFEPLLYQLEWTGSRWEVTGSNTMFGDVTGYLECLDAGWHLVLNSSTATVIGEAMLTVVNCDEPAFTGTTTEGYPVSIVGP